MHRTTTRYSALGKAMSSDLVAIASALLSVVGSNQDLRRITASHPAASSTIRNPLNGRLCTSRRTATHPERIPTSSDPQSCASPALRPLQTPGLISSSLLASLSRTRLAQCPGAWRDRRDLTGTPGDCPRAPWVAPLRPAFGLSGNPRCSPYFAEPSGKNHSPLVPYRSTYDSGLESLSSIVMLYAVAVLGVPGAYVTEDRSVDWAKIHGLAT
jgi:hypothetical protein